MKVLKYKSRYVLKYKRRYVLKYKSTKVRKKKRANMQFHNRISARFIFFGKSKLALFTFLSLLKTPHCSVPHPTHHSP